MRSPRFLSTIALSGALASSIGATAWAGDGPGTRDDVESASDSSLATELHADDAIDAGGHHFRNRTLMLRGGEYVDIGASSSEFDTVLHVRGHGLDLSNDDAPGERTNSRLRFRAPASGAYQVTVTSYNAGETGEYDLTIQHAVDEASVGTDDGVADNEDDPASSGGANARIAPAVTGRPRCNGSACPLPGTAQPQSWAWDPARNMFVPAAGSAPARADGEADAEPGDDTSDAPDDGAVEPGTVVAPPAGAGLGTVYGVFAGVSNYGGDHSLEDTANDARQLEAAFERRGLIHHGNGIVLTDSDVTPGSIRHAFQTLATRVTARDTFVFFFDGHGNSNEIELQSGRGLSARDLSGLLDRVSGQQLVVLDSCESGGFASIVRNNPHRVGLFSSRASESSFVATEVHAGGWLAYYMILAVREGVHGADGGMHVSDLAAYVQRGYRQRVGDQQHLVVASGEGQGATLWHDVPRANVVAMNR